MESGSDNKVIAIPKVSVRIPAYNHEKYIKECIDSVLNQTFQDFEIIITDDGSSDRTVEIIKEYNDPRIKLLKHDRNYGLACAIETCLKKATGVYVANLCTDDAWAPDKLEKQVKFLDMHPEIDAVFTKVAIIDENSNPYSGDHFYSTVFDVENRSREEWLNHFFYYGNCLCIPSVLIRKNVYTDLKFQDKRMAGLLDFDLWVRFSFEHDFFILNEKLTKFRLRDNEANLSGNRIETQIRNHFEYKNILNHYLTIDRVDFFKKIFPECQNTKDFSSGLIPFFLGKLAVNTNERFKQSWGLETIFDVLKNETLMTELITNFDFSYKDFYLLTSQIDIYNLSQLDSLSTELAQRNEYLKQLQDHLSQQMKTVTDLSTEINNLNNTLSWRITKPLRILKRNSIALIKMFF